MKLRSPPCNKDLRPFDPDPYSFVFHCSSVSCAPNQNNDRISSDASHTWRKLHKSNNVLNLSCPKRSLYEMSVGMRCVATVWVLLIKIIIFFEDCPHWKMRWSEPFVLCVWFSMWHWLHTERPMVLPNSLISDGNFFLIAWISKHAAISSVLSEQEWHTKTFSFFNFNPWFCACIVLWIHARHQPVGAIFKTIKKKRKSLEWRLMKLT